MITVKRLTADEAPSSDRTMQTVPSVVVSFTVNQSFILGFEQDHRSPAGDELQQQITLRAACLCLWDLVWSNRILQEVGIRPSVKQVCTHRHCTIFSLHKHSSVP